MKLPLLLLAFAALFAWASMVLEQQSSADEIVASHRARTAPPAAAIRESDTRAAAASEMTNGPSLFRAAQAPAEPAPTLGERFELVGLTGGGGVRIALLRDAADRQSFRVREGEEVRAWRVDSVTERCVALVRARRRQSVCLS